MAEGQESHCLTRGDGNGKTSLQEVALRFEKIHKSLVFRIVFPLVAILIITYRILYILVLRNISEFTESTIKARMDEWRHYSIRFAMRA